MVHPQEQLCLEHRRVLLKVIDQSIKTSMVLLSSENYYSWIQTIEANGNVI